MSTSTDKPSSSFIDRLNTDEMSNLKKHLTQWREKKAQTTNLNVIPPFYVPSVPDNDDGIRSKLREAARNRMNERRNSQLLNSDELNQIWSLLNNNYTEPIVDEEKFIGYDNFKVVADQAPVKAREFFRASVFGKLHQRDPNGRVSIINLFNYIMRKTALRQYRIHLSVYDMAGKGYLREKDLDSYILDLIPTLPKLAHMEVCKLYIFQKQTSIESFYSFYSCTAVRKFMFFLDQKQQHRIRIVDLLASGFLDELFELRVISRTDSLMIGDDDERSSARESAATITDLESNWFSAENAARVYGSYLNLDTDRNGMLSKSELKEYGTGLLTSAFIERVFQECLTYEGEMDYKGYLNFVLAMENKSDPSAIEYFFRILDVRQCGYLDAFAINYFFRDIQKMLAADEQMVVPLDDIKDEIYDMCRPKHASHITLRDLIESKNAATLIGILIDLEAFYKYENREYLGPENDGDDTVAINEVDGAEEDATELQI